MLDVVRLRDLGISDQTALSQAVRDSMTASGANLALWRTAIRVSSEDADITDQVIARIKGETVDHPSAKAFAPRLEALDMEAAKRFGATHDEVAINAATTNWMKDSKANLVLDKQAFLVAATDAADVTGDVIATLTHKPAQTMVRPVEGRIMTVGRKALMQYSKAGQDIARQMKVYADAAKQEFGQRGAELEKKGKALQEAFPTLSRDEKALRLTVFKEEEEALEASVQRRDAQIKEAFEAARHAVELAFQPVLLKMMRDHGVEAVLDLDAAYASSPGLDVTGEAIEKLDVVLGSVPVTLTDKPPSGRPN
jgi:Skp family chaperone for outer membrane proteins